MIITVFVIMATISLFLISLGYFVNESVYPIIGFFFLFLLSISIIIPGNLEYQLGENVTQNYTYQNATLHSINEIHMNTYEKFDSPSAHWFGVWLSVISGVGIAISLVEIKSLRREGGE